MADTRRQGPANWEQWYLDHTEMSIFFRVLADGGYFGSEKQVDNIISAIEKPYKYTREYVIWLRAGRPDAFDMFEAVDALNQKEDLTQEQTAPTSTSPTKK